ncbi:MAG: hypothetical protein LBD25_06630 [Coriobacteriales bacterium]|jgi:hypothetical protein|nr:hypothetical protein [Coriobacteriales bacterium]
MKIGKLRSIIDCFDDDQEVTINVEFPDVGGWTVTTDDISFDVGTYNGTLSLAIAVYLSDFDYTDVWQKLREVVNEAPSSRL